MLMTRVWSATRKATLVSKGHGAMGAILIWMAYAATGAMLLSWLWLLPKATSGFVILLHQGSVMMSVAGVSTVDTCEI